jgi:predicted kinase
MNVYILRGISGSGKTTFAKKINGKSYIVSADDYFMTSNGVYKFDAMKLQSAHDNCFRNFVHVISDCQQSNFDNVIVDNTNLSIAEIAPYYACAQAFGHEVKIITLKCEPSVAFKRNLHHVPLNTIFKQLDKMMNEMKFFPRWWKHEVQ